MFSFSFVNHFFPSRLSATWASTTRPHCSISETVRSTRWTDPSSSLTPLASPCGYTTCPCRKRPKLCSRLERRHRERTRSCSHDVHKNIKTLFFSLSGAELQLPHRNRSPRIALHFFPPLPASPALHPHRQQHPAHHKRVKVPPAHSGLHRLPGGTKKKQNTLCQIIVKLFSGQYPKKISVVVH